MHYFKILAAATVALMVAGCTVGPIYQTPPPTTLAQFQAVLPAAGAQSESPSDLTNWWRQFDDPLVAELVAAAEAGHPSLTQAKARIWQARASAKSAAAAQFPEIDANLNSARSRVSDVTDGNITMTANSGSFDALWEIDLFGAKRQATEAANARVSARMDDWHAARVSLAAEVAGTLVDYRACVMNKTLLAQDLGSRDQTAKLSKLKIKAGFTAPADAALSDASSADARQRLIAQGAVCDLDIKALVALTDMAEPVLRSKLDSNARLPRPSDIVVDMVPAHVLSQRPDIASAERELAAAGAEIDVAEAKRYPSVSLTGNVGIVGLRYDGTSGTANTWTIFPAIDIPLFDAGRRKAEANVAQARYDEAYAVYQQRVRNAVREIEEALVRLDSAARREADAASAARDYDRYFHASDEKFKAGTGSLFELEEARRNSLFAQQTLIGVQHERVTAWITLYKAMGGGWHADAAQASNRSLPTDHS